MAFEDYREYRMRCAQVTVQAWKDRAFRRQLLATPADVLREYGIAVPDDRIVRIVEDTADIVHFVLPALPGSGRIPSVEELADPEQAGPEYCGFILPPP